MFNYDITKLQNGEESLDDAIAAIKEKLTKEVEKNKTVNETREQLITAIHNYFVARHGNKAPKISTISACINEMEKGHLTISDFTRHLIL